MLWRSLFGAKAAKTVVCPECRKRIAFGAAFERAFCFAGDPPAIGFRCPECSGSAYFRPMGSQVEVGFLGASPTFDPIPGDRYPIRLGWRRDRQMLAIEHDGKRKVIPGARAYVEGCAQNAAPVELGGVPVAIVEVVTAARQLGYEIETVAQCSKALAVHMKTPLRPEDREVLIRRFPELERWFYSGSPHNPPDEGFRDAVSGGAISFPAWTGSR